MNCKNCGAPLDEGALFCRKCGTAVPEPAEPQKSVFQDWKPSKRKPKPASRERKKPEQAVFADLRPAERKPQEHIAEKPVQERRPQEHIAEKPVQEHRPQEHISEKPVRERGPEPGEEKPKKRALSGLTLEKILHNRRLLLFCGAVLLLLILLTVVIVSISSCKKPERYTAPEDVRDAVVSALERGDGKTLARMAKLSETALGRHPETFGEGDSPEAVMKGYYERLAADLSARLSERFGKDFRLESETETKLLSGTEIFEPNRALGLEATRFAEITGTLTVAGETAASIRIVAAETDGEWKLIVVYVY